jgi:hypothetical protein
MSDYSGLVSLGNDDRPMSMEGIYILNQMKELKAFPGLQDPLCKTSSKSGGTSFCKRGSKL